MYVILCIRNSTHGITGRAGQVRSPAPLSDRCAEAPWTIHPPHALLAHPLPTGPFPAARFSHALSYVSTQCFSSDPDTQRWHGDLPLPAVTFHLYATYSVPSISFFLVNLRGLNLLWLASPLLRISTLRRLQTMWVKACPFDR